MCDNEMKLEVVPSSTNFELSDCSSSVDFEVVSNQSSVIFEAVSVPTSHVDTVIDEVCVNTEPLPVVNKSVNVDLMPYASREALQGNTAYIIGVIENEKDTSISAQEIDQLFN